MTGAILAPSDPHSIAQSISTFDNIVKATPRDKNGFLSYFVDYGVIPPNFDSMDSERQAEFLNAGMIMLSMTEGYLSRDFTKPVWLQLPHEPDLQYQAFTMYLGHHGRSLEEAEDIMTKSTSTFTAHTVREAYVYFYWQERARAYDIQRPIAAARLNDQRVNLMTDSHYNLALSLRAQLTQEMVVRGNETEGRPFAGLKASELLNGIIAMTEVERVALGLPARGPLLKDTSYKPAPSASIERNVRTGASNYDGMQDSTANAAARLKQRVERMLAANPEKAAAMQEAMLDVMMQANDEIHREDHPHEYDGAAAKNEPPGGST